MERLVLYSRDPKLYSALTSAMSAGFSLTIDSSQVRVMDMISKKKCDVVILDFECDPAAEQFKFIDELQINGVPLVVLAETDRGTLAELVQRGVHRYCQKPL